MARKAMQWIALAAVCLLAGCVAGLPRWFRAEDRNAPLIAATEIAAREWGQEHELACADFANHCVAQR